MTGSWLFARHGDAIWIHRHDEQDLEVRIDGPGALRRSYTFSTEAELEDFLSGIEDRLLETGWTFQRYESDEERRSGVERRRSAAMQRRLQR